MSNLKYKLLLCVVAVMLLSIPLYASVQEVWSWNFDPSEGSASAGWVLTGEWAVGAPAGGGGDPTAAGSDGNILGTNIGATGLYGNSISEPETATTPEFDCSGMHGVTLTFSRWLRVEDNANDQAVIQVSNDGTNWNDVWANPSKQNADKTDYVDDLLDSSWNTVTYDISEWADDQAAVQIRWSLATNGTSQFGGWNVDNIVVNASADDAVYSWPIDAAGTPTDWTLDGQWEVGAAVAGGGQTVDTNSDGIPDTLVGADPAADADGDTFLLGYNIGGNYGISMQAEYATSPHLDLSGLVGCAVRFDRYLELSDGAYDQANVQLHIHPADNDVGDEVEEFDVQDAVVGLSKTTKSHVWTIDTAEFYSNVFSVKYVVAGMVAGDSLTVSYATTNTGSTTWTPLVTDTTNTATDATETVTSPVLPVAYSDGKLYVKVALVISDTAAATASIKKVATSGVSWKYAWKAPSPAAGKTDCDTKWTTQSVDISSADGEPDVQFRIAMGPTDGIASSKFGGWSLDNIEVVEGSRQFKSAGVDAPGAMVWDEEGDLTVSLQNTGTAVWDEQHAAYNVLARSEDVTDLANPGETKTVRENQDAAIDRWNAPEIDVAEGDTVAPGDIYDFPATITAPLLSSVVYATPVGVTAPPDAALSLLDADYALGSEVRGEFAFAPALDDSGVASTAIMVTRFPDDQVVSATTGGWARPWIEELAGGVPFVVQGYPNGTYRPKNLVDRASIAVYIQRAANVPTAPDAQIFHDVDSDQWAYAQINAVYTAHIIAGYPDLTYHPDTIVTRDQMCKFIVNGVNAPSAHPGAITIPTIPDTQAAQDAFPFGDVDVFNNTETTGDQVDERNPLANYILAAYNADIVQGYPVPAGSPEGTKPNFQPAGQIMRDQLAVFVWRGFMRDFPSVVALGGPGITQAILADDLTPTSPGGLAPYNGFADLKDIIWNDDDATAYVTLDAVRLNGMPVTGLTQLNVSFSLTEGANSGILSPVTVSVSPATVNAQLASILSDDPNLDTDGEPYMTIAAPLPIATADHGTYKLVTSINGVELSRKPTLRIIHNMMVETAGSGAFVLPGWEMSGQPTTLNFYPQALLAANPDADVNDDLFLGTSSIELQKTQVITRALSTAGRHDIRLSLNIAGVKFADADTITVQWTKDGGAHWIDAYSVDGTAIADNMKDGLVKDIELPNGLKWTNYQAWVDAGSHQNDYDNLGADDNTNFKIRITISGSTDARGYVDNITVSGT